MSFAQAMHIEVALPGGFEHGGSWRRRLYLRPLSGEEEAFLAEELAGAPPAVRTTALLACCLSLAPGGEPLGADLARALTVGDREALLLHLRRATLGERLSALLACPACGQKLDLDLEVGSLLLPPYEHAGAEHETELEAGGARCRVRFRLPTGADQEWAAPLAARDPEAAARGVVERCVLAVRGEDGAELSPLPPALVEALPELLSGTMAALDPQAEIAIDASCPACGEALSTLLDAGQYFALELTERSEWLWREVHLLAWHYHWSESEILRLPARKRRRYLRLLDEALAEGRAG